MDKYRLHKALMFWGHFCFCPTCQLTLANPTDTVIEKPGGTALVPIQEAQVALQAVNLDEN